MQMEKMCEEHMELENNTVIQLLELLVPCLCRKRSCDIHMEKTRNTLSILFLLYFATAFSHALCVQ